MSDDVELLVGHMYDTYQYDAEGHYIGIDPAQCVMGDDGVPYVSLAPDCTDVIPDLQDGYWSVFDKETETWSNVKKPTTAAECVGIIIEHTDHCEYAEEMRRLFDELVAADSDNYRIVQDPETNNKTVEAIPEKTLEEVRAEKLDEISAVAGAYDSYKCETMYITSSVEGYRFNADARSQNNISALIDNMSDTDTALFKDYDNEYRSLTKAQLETVLSECIQNGQALYAQKWALQAAAQAATTIEEIKAIEVVFTMQDFYNVTTESTDSETTDTDSVITETTTTETDTTTEEE